MRKSVSLLAAFVLLFSLGAIAQGTNGTIKGFVYDKKTGEPMIYTNVIVANGKTGVQTDVNGYFSLTLPSGSYVLITTALGYDSSVLELNLLPGAIVNKKIMLGRKETTLKDVDISARKTEKITHIGTGVTSVTPRELKLLPSSGGEPDLAQYLQVIPGVVFTGDQGGQLYIRGGSPAQTGIYLDGVTIYNPFHSIGLFSVFETEAIRNVDVYTAGFGAQYGNRTSAIVDVRTKDGNKNEVSGVASISPIMGRAVLEGPIYKSKREDGSSITFLVTGKYSWLDQTSKSLYAGLGEPFKSGLPYSFADLYGKVTFNGDNGSKLNVFGFNFDDRANLLNTTTHTPVADYKWNAKGAGSTFVVSPGSSAALIDGKFALSRYDISLDKTDVTTDTLPRTSSIGGFEAGINFTYFLSGYSQLKYGVEVSGLNTSLSYYSAAGISTTSDRRSTMAALFGTYRKNINGKFIMEPGLRVQYYSELQRLSFQPRLGLKYNVTDNVRLKGSAGLYAQNIISTKSDKDIVNLFTGFMLSPDQQIVDADHNTVSSNLQTSAHAVAGIEVDISKVELNLEPWVKKFGTVIELNRNKMFGNEPDFTSADGLAYGVDVSAKYNYKRIYLWAAMGYQVVNYTSLDAKGQKQTYPTPFDTRLNSNAVVSYAAGKKKEWDISFRFNIHSPFPFTQTQGFYSNYNMTPIGTNILTQNGNLSFIYDDKINGGRLSWYHRLDFSAKRRFDLNKKVTLDATAAISNVYDRQNIFYVDRLTNEKIYQLPFFPSVNLTLNF